METVPNSCFILVIGGGPAGSYAASCLAREGHSVVVLEAEKFPRYHVGESMLPSMRHFLRFIDLEEQFEEHGFIKKMGAAFKFNPSKREGYSDFTLLNKENYSWNVVRSEADALLLKQARASGAQVFEETRVTAVDFEDRDDTPCPVSVSWKNNQGDVGRISFDWLIDASGRNGVLARHLGTRKFNQSLKNVASWGYWKGTGRYENPAASVPPPFFEALNDESGWAWFIPLHNGTTSVGIVMDEATSKDKKSKMDREDPSPLSLRHYFEELNLAPRIQSLIGDGVFVQEANKPQIRSASDYSYSSTSYSGPNYRLIGDAAAFIDPFFSSGVHLALSGGLSAAATICAALRQDCTVAEASHWHNVRIGTSYTRFLLVVLSAYRQIRAQKLPVLSDIDEDNFDRAFDHFRVVIQGEADSAVTPLSEEELRRTIDFCSKAFEPAALEDHLGAIDERNAKACEASDAAKNQLQQEVFTANKTLGAEEILHINKFVTDKLDGMCIRFEKGSLGLDH